MLGTCPFRQRTWNNTQISQICHNFDQIPAGGDTGGITLAGGVTGGAEAANSFTPEAVGGDEGGRRRRRTWERSRNISAQGSRSNFSVNLYRLSKLRKFRTYLGLG